MINQFAVYIPFNGIGFFTSIKSNLVFNRVLHHSIYGL